MHSVSKVPRASRATSVLSALVGVLVFSVALFSQANYGRILGIVTDQTGGVISGATVTVIDTTAELLGRAKPKRPRARASVQRKTPVKKAGAATHRVGRSRKAAASDDNTR